MRFLLEELFPDVSRETLDLLSSYCNFLLKWNQSINLISKQLAPKELLQTHIEEALLGANLLLHCRKIIDAGSGSGLPGIVYAIFAKTVKTGQKITLCEIDKKKAAFLTHVINALDLNNNAEVSNQGYQDLNSRNYDTFSSKAFLSIKGCLNFGAKNVITYKSEPQLKELSDIENFKFELKVIPNRFYNNRKVIFLGNIRHV